MVRKSLILRLVALACALAAMLPLAAAASAAEYNVYAGNLSGTYTDYARDLLGSVGLEDSYLFFRSGQYEYILLVGDLTYENGVFSAPAAMEYKFLTGTNYGTDYSYTVTEVSDVSLSPGRGMVYSDLGDYPELRDPSQLLELVQVFLLAMYGVMFLVHCIFSFVLRRR